MTMDQASSGRPEDQIGSAREVGRDEKSLGAAGVGVADAGGMWPLAEAKLAAPRQRARVVDRPRICGGWMPVRMRR
jgi:hypothetical protein